MEQSMKSVVITGSTRGIGLGMADTFLEKGCSVVVSGRSQNSVDIAVASLTERYNAELVLGQPCDVTDAAQVQALWDAAVARFGRIDIWINNAGISHDTEKLWDLPTEIVHDVILTNMLGVTNGMQTAIRGMLAQGGGFVYNMEGFGSTGSMRDGFSIYGMTKRGVTYLTKAAVKEIEGTPVKIGALYPGMVITDLILDRFKDDPEGLEKNKRIFNIIGDKVETVSPWLVEQMLSNEKNGADIRWLTRPKLIGRFLTAPISKRNNFD
jgi:NAD(P)-dependent dehydrogenase (short-subunit alcohol dehydrogenase family)